MKHLPIAKTELREIVEEECLYVDKTAYVKMLLEDRHKYYFLSRPRRFGKTLFLDTLRAAFSGEKDLFQGLFLEENWEWDLSYPVFHVSFGRVAVKDASELKIFLQNLLTDMALKFGVSLRGDLVFERFYSLLEALHAKHGAPAVVLIDEYDKPLLDNLTLENVDDIRRELADFYSVLKDAGSHLKFVFLTGVSRFSKAGILSKLNTLTDISLSPKYADICGITQDEMESVFADFLHNVDLQKIAQWYKGYNFLGSQIYNPYVLLMFLWDKRYKCYWSGTGTPTFLLELIQQRKFYLPKLERINIAESMMEDFDLKHIQLDVLLFQAGYLTIQELRQIGSQDVYSLKLPNKDVKMGLNGYLLRMFYASALEPSEQTLLAEQIYYALTDGEPSKLEDIFKSFFAAIPVDWYRKNRIAEHEGFYCSMFYAIFASMGLQLTAEDVTNKGRIDLSICLNDAVFIFEFKMKTQPQNALQQIKDRKYYEKYLSKSANIFLIGIEFDEEERNISAFECEQLKISQEKRSAFAAETQRR